MEGIISHKCLGVENVNLLNVGIEMLCHFFIFNITESSERMSGPDLSWPLGRPAERSPHWLAWVMCSLLVLSATEASLYRNLCPWDASQLLPSGNAAVCVCVGGDRAVAEELRMQNPETDQ